MFGSIVCVSAIGIVLSVGRNVEQLEGKAPIETGVAPVDTTPVSVAAVAASGALTNSFQNQNPRANG